MKKIISILVVLCFARYCLTGLAQEKPVESWTAARTIKISHCPMNVNILNNVINSSLKDRLGKEFLNLNDSVQDVFQMDCSTVSSSSNDDVILTLQIWIHNKALPAKADEIADEVVRWLDKIVKVEYAITRQDLEKKYDRLTQNIKESEMVLHMLNAQVRDLREKAGRSDLSRDNILREIESLEKEQRQLLMDQTGNEARQQAILLEIDKTKNITENKIANDPVVEQLQEIVNMRAEELAGLETLNELSETTSTAPARPSATSTRSTGQAPPLPVVPRPTIPATPTTIGEDTLPSQSARVRTTATRELSPRENTLKILEQEIQFTVNDIEFGEVIIMLKKAGGKESNLNIFVNWSMLDNYGITSDCLVKIDLQKASIKKIIELLCRYMSGLTAQSKETITYEIDDEGVIVISTARDIMEQEELRNLRTGRMPGGMGMMPGGGGMGMGMSGLGGGMNPMGAGMGGGGFGGMLGGGMEMGMPGGHSGYGSAPQPSISKKDLSDARIRLAQAKAELANHIESVRKDTGGELLAKFNSMLSDMTITNAENAARLEFIAKQLVQIRESNLLEIADQYETDIRLQIQITEKKLLDGTQQLNQLDRSFESLIVPQVSEF